uniref:Uncharacterized protein n=1 Tax=Echinococcus canadensis TaxID=519352 RepID=A0A915EZY2_9CEST
VLTHEIRISFFINAFDRLPCRRILACGRRDVDSSTTIAIITFDATTTAADTDVKMDSEVKAFATNSGLGSSVTVATTSVTYPSQASPPISLLTLLFFLLFARFNISYSSTRYPQMLKLEQEKRVQKFTGHQEGCSVNKADKYFYLKYLSNYVVVIISQSAPTTEASMSCLSLAPVIKEPESSDLTFTLPCIASIHSLIRSCCCWRCCYSLITQKDKKWTVCEEMVKLVVNISEVSQSLTSCVSTAKERSKPRDVNPSHTIITSTKQTDEAHFIPQIQLLLIMKTFNYERIFYKDSYDAFKVVFIPFSSKKYAIALPPREIGLKVCAEGVGSVLNIPENDIQIEKWVRSRLFDYAWTLLINGWMFF